MSTLVKFLKDSMSNKGVFAYFPQLNYNKYLFGNEVKSCYAHIGQHQSCPVSYAEECEPATFEEYKDLKKELESYPFEYKLKVLNK